MVGILHGHVGNAVRPGLGHGQFKGPGADDLALAVITVDDRQCRRAFVDLDFRGGPDHAGADPLQVLIKPMNPMRGNAHEVRGDENFGHGFRVARGKTGPFERPLGKAGELFC